VHLFFLLVVGAISPRTIGEFPHRILPLLIVGAVVEYLSVRFSGSSEFGKCRKFPFFG